MGTSLSNAVLESMGHRPLSESETISACFHYLHIFEVRGFNVEEPSLPPRTGTIAGRTYKLGVGKSVNAVCQTLTQNDLADSEQEWQGEHKCTPPYLVVHLGPSKEYRFTGTHAKFDDSTIHTYDGFAEARIELHAWGQAVLPSVLAGLASSFSLHDQPVKFVPTDRTFYGMTRDGRTVLDMYITASGSFYGSTPLSAAQAAERLDSATRIASSVKLKVARFFYLALNEEDQLKRFLYFFLAIEIETHATFSRIDHIGKLRTFILAPAHATGTTKTFFDGQSQNWKSLGDRFVWCVICAWPHLSDPDVDEFKLLKKIRDDIAHGSIDAPPFDAVVAVEKLATKLQLPIP